MTTIQFDVGGMTCASCVKSVEDAINTIHGVKEVKVDLALGEVVISGDISQNVQAIIESLNQAGYSAQVSKDAHMKSVSSTCKNGSKSCCGASKNGEIK